MEDTDNVVGVAGESPIASQTKAVLETGEGSLLEHTVSLVETRNRSALRRVVVENGLEPSLIELSPAGGIEVVEPTEFNASRLKPLYRAGTANLTSLAALVAYTNRYKDEKQTVAFARDDRASPSLTTIFDYHLEGGPEDGGQRFGRHQAKFALPLSNEWKAWSELNGDTITMPNFARFLEDHIVDVVPPGMLALSPAQEQFVETLGGREKIADPAKLMEIATGLRIFENSQVSQATNLQSGEGELIFTNEHQNAQGGKLIIPSMFVIELPVFRHGDRYQIIARLRYRKTGQGVVFVYELWRDDLVFDDAFSQALGTFEKDTGITPFLGDRGNS